MRKALFPLFLFLIFALVLSGCAANLPVAKDTVVTFNYTGKTSDGTEFGTTVGKQPITVLIGEHNIIPGLEKGMIGMKAGEKKTVQVPAAEGYGPHQASLVIQVPRDKFPKGEELKAGMEFMTQGPQGPMPVRIDKVDKDTVTVDMNHPLAGKDLVFDIQVVSVRKATADEIAGKVPITPVPTKPEKTPPAPVKATP